MRNYLVKYILGFIIFCALVYCSLLIYFNHIGDRQEIAKEYIKSEAERLAKVKCSSQYPDKGKAFEKCINEEQSATTQNLKK